MRYHVVLLWSVVVGDWLSVGMWFGACCAPGARRQAGGLVYPVFVARATWFGLPDVCSAKRDQVGLRVECQEIHDGVNIQVGLMLGERTMGHVKLLLSKGGLLMRGEVD